MKPYAWINVNDKYKILFDDELPTYYPQAWMPLYTHPAKTLTDDPLANFKPVWQEVPAIKELTDEEIQELALSDEFWISEDCTIFDWHKFAKAILKKAQGEG